MSQTDRQTDKSTHWKSAIFDTDDNWSKLDAIPPFVKEVHRQKEVCPTTGKEHFQVHIVCNRQVRLSAMTGWIKATKWLPVLGKIHIENSIKYCSKTDTAVPGTHQVIQGEKYLQLHELLFEIAKYAEYQWADTIDVNSWERITSRLLEVKNDLTWANKLNAPGVKNAWSWWGNVFIRKYQDFLDETAGASIIEGTSQEEVPAECLIE